MKLLIVAVGHKMDAWVNTGFGEYAKRMPREARIELVEIKPEPRSSGKSTIQIMAAEAQRIDAAVPDDTLRVALDERAPQLTTKQIAQQMQMWMGRGCDVAFIIGGADGLHEPLKKSAQHMLSLSAMTLPHGLARVILAEQLYRAHSILHNHPYHRE